MASVLPPMCGKLTCTSNNTVDQHSQKQIHGKRLTMVERARLEALAAFGNEGFDSLSMKKDDFHAKLQSSVTKTTSTNQSRALTRLERAKMEANSAFKNVKLGQMIPNRNKRKLQDSDSQNQVPKKKILTRLQKAKVEVDKAFENVSLSTIPKKRSRLEEEKIISNYKGKTERKKAENHCVSNTLPVSTRRITRSESAKVVAFKSSKGSELERLPLSDSNKQSVSSDTKKELLEPKNDTEVEERNLNRIEKAKLEAIESFKGEHFEEICKESKKIVAKYLNPKLSKHKSEPEPSSKTKETYLSTTLIESHKKQVTPAYSAQMLHRKKDPAVTSSQTLDKEEILQSTKQECMATPLQARSNKQTTCGQAYSKLSSRLYAGSTWVTSCTSHRESYMQPNIDLYSSIKGDENFNDHTVLLETSKRVVETAVSLETPEGSPMLNIK